MLNLEINTEKPLEYIKDFKKTCFVSDGYSRSINRTNLLYPLNSVIQKSRNSSLLDRT